MSTRSHFVGSPVLVADNQPVPQVAVQGHFYSNANPVVAWTGSVDGLRSTGTGGAFGAPVPFSMSSHDDIDAQIFQAFSASLKEDLSLFHALEHNSASGPDYVHRVQGITPDQALDLRTIAVPPDPSNP